MGSLTQYIRVIVLACCFAGVAWAQSPSQIKSSQTDDGALIEFIEGEFILADGVQASNEPWKPAPNPNIYQMNETGWRVGDYHTLMGRFYFERQMLDSPPLALYTVSTRNNFTIYVNGAEVFRNFADVSDLNTPWYRPFLIPIPGGALTDGLNEIVFHVVSKESVGIGRVIVGPNEALKSYHRSKFFWQITAPKAANFAMLLLGALAFLFWLGRRQEIELLWLSVSTLLWFGRNYQFFAEAAPFNIGLYNVVPIYATYFASVATAAFYFYFIKLPHRKQITFWLFVAGIPFVLAHYLFSTSDFVLYIPTTAIVFCVAILGFLEAKKQFNIEHGVLAVGMMTTPLATLYDLFIAFRFGGDGNATYVAVFGGFFYAVAFIISFGKRALDAFTYLGEANVILERRIAETRAELAESEAARQKLVVSQALEGERGRLMQEMHDGIGSNLITSLAVARQQNQPKGTIRTLSRALNDLKITVDSLEPVEGDLVALIGNLRHRMAGDLQAAGISCKWEVEECKPLPWLDATNALHVLRIYSEAIGNVLTHSGATEMKIGCIEREHDGVAGILTYVSDNGRGFDANQAAHGKGLSNIRARAKSLHGILSHESNSETGTTVTLWLPYKRSNKTISGEQA